MVARAVCPPVGRTAVELIFCFIMQYDPPVSKQFYGLNGIYRRQGRHSTVEPCVLWGLRGLQAQGFKSCPRSECRLGFLTWGNGFLEGGL
ncbi:hypothetical protein E2C01_095123 [Portunus trituberculatus]|uniref:Uncharacterized protein n=1 Tax=Portunus trituberculatus TaxID=210409 RepID=A0A5B7JYP9_PORTR|nr:hypothetical protein [Portunus trituberculatus]